MSRFFQALLERYVTISLCNMQAEGRRAHRIRGNRTMLLVLLFWMPPCRDAVFGRVAAYGLHVSRPFPQLRPQGWSPTYAARRVHSMTALAGSDDNSRSANKNVQQKLAELEALRAKVAARQGSDVAAAEEAAKKAAEQAAKKKEAAELNRKLEEMMEKKRLENEERLATAQARRGLAGIKVSVREEVKHETFGICRNAPENAF